MAKTNWTRDELILAFNLYCKIPFGRIHLRNPEIISLARAIGRTPSAVSWKLANFARLDPALKQRRISGATHGAKGEEAVWKEFNNNWDQLAFESERLMSRLTRQPIRLQYSDNFPEGKSREAIVRVRVNQAFFRASVLAAYNSRCCITGLSVPELLTASHIIPWSIDPKNRTNPRNGLCLNAVHDRAFDCGLLTVTPDYVIRVSERVERKPGDTAVRSFLLSYAGQKVTLPERFQPEGDFLRYHNDRIFRS